MSRIAISTAIGAALAISSPAEAQASRRYDIAIPAGSLDFALQLLARQTGTTVGGTGVGLASVRVESVHGRMTAHEALRRLLANTRFEAVAAGPDSFRIAPRSGPAISPNQSAPASPPNSVTPLRTPEPIIVTASKRALPIEEFPGGVSIFDFDAARPSQESGGVGDVLAAIPVTGSTALGPGRNKIFIRGVSDSSFNGPTQATIGMYFGEQRLIYSAPDPALRLYDIERIELLEGPQGTLYGAGALGGLVRIIPNRPVPGEWSARFWGGGALTDRGEAGFDVAAGANIPVGENAALRALVYQGRLGGYIDDIGLGRNDVNRTNISGGRAAFRLELDSGWTIDAGGLFQTLHTRDGQYSERGLPPLTRRSAIAQPFDSNVSSAGITIGKQWDGVRLVSATGIVRNSLDIRFDATSLSASGVPTVFDEDRRVRLISHETRLSGGAADRGWVIGVEALNSADRLSQFLGAPTEPDLFARTNNGTSEAALFGEGSIALAGRLIATAGARIVYADSTASRTSDNGVELELRTHFFRTLPAGALSWRVDSNLLAYLRYQQGYRTGGISIADEAATDVAHFEADELRTIEAGLRRSAGDALPLDLRLAGFWTKWDEIQADLLTGKGFPYTANIGSGEIIGFTASANYHPAEGIQLAGAIFANDSSLNSIDAFTEPTQIPNVAELGAQASLGYSYAVSGTARIDAGTALSYVGRSRLGIGPLLDIGQGDYATLAAHLTYRTDRFTIALEGENLTNSIRNRFGFGNPFILDRRSQLTPLRPRTIRFSTSIRF